MISKFVAKHQKDWDQYLPSLMMDYRSSVHETLGETPCFMMMGREEPAPLDFTTSITNSLSQELAELSPTENILDLSITRTTTLTIATSSILDIITSSNTIESTASSKESIATIQELPLDLSMKTTTKLNQKPVEIPRKPFSPIIDCTLPTDIWNVKPLSLETNNYEHLRLDPRVFFAGAPSQYNNHMLASTLKEKVNLCRTS
ncbi:unnamed protein product [Mytilus coruscus]|uniref:Integrase catalytic domain-containing protein n=1 Tax=Mytilus coruscus TaxID=42192 RepID=A0A6J8BQ75_MYTCO|nr:unnamed protein product [Mytilus coruscus]